MKIIRCPSCFRVKFIDAETNKVVWLKLTEQEEVSILTIIDSDPLLVLVHNYLLCAETCSECKIAKSN